MTSTIYCRAWAKSSRFDRQHLDLSQPDEIRRVVREIHPNLIVNAAAYTAVDQAEKEESLAAAINARAPAILAEEAKRIGAASRSLFHRLRFRWHEEFSVRGKRSHESAECIWKNKAGGRAGDSRVRRASFDFSDSVGVFHARQEFFAYDFAARHRTRRDANRE